MFKSSKLVVLLWVRWWCSVSQRQRALRLRILGESKTNFDVGWFDRDDVWRPSFKRQLTLRWHRQPYSRLLEHQTRWHRHRFWNRIDSQWPGILVYEFRLFTSKTDLRSTVFSTKWKNRRLVHRRNLRCSYVKNGRRKEKLAKIESATLHRRLEVTVQTLRK